MIKALSSLKITITTLFLFMLLVFFGTLAQTESSIFDVQDRFFRSFFIFYNQGHIPIFPGGYTLGLILLINLTASFFFQFKWTLRKSGILLIHLGLVFLIVSELITALFAKETQMQLPLNQRVSYLEYPRQAELVIIDKQDPDFDKVISVPEKLLKSGKKISLPDSPFSVQTRVEPRKEDSNDQYLLTATVLLWKDDEPFEKLWLSTTMSPQNIGKNHTIALRKMRQYLPFSIELNQFERTMHPGTDIPKSFTSFISIFDHAGNKERKTSIFMNHPLHFEEKTFYQASFGKSDTLSILHVVQNPAKQIPYISTAIIAVGLMIQFIQGMRGRRS